MARLTRLYIPGQPQHVILRARQDCRAFRDDEDYRYFAQSLKTAAREHGLAVHAYVLLPESVRLAATPRDEHSLPKTMQAVGRRYVAYFNRRHGGKGALWNGRYRSTVIDAAGYLLACSRDIDLSAVDLCLVAQPEAYAWSSYRHHAGLAADALVSDHPLYWSLGNTPFERQHRYREWCEESPDRALLAKLEEATLKGWVLGDAAFMAQCAGRANRRLAPLSRGRPRKQPGPST